MFFLVQEVVIENIVIDVAFVVECQLEVLEGDIVLHSDLASVDAGLASQPVQLHLLVEVTAPAHDAFLLDVARHFVVCLPHDVVTGALPQDHFPKELPHVTFIINL